MDENASSVGSGSDNARPRGAFRRALPDHPWYLLAGLLGVVGLTAAAFMIDCPVALWLRDGGAPGELGRYLKVIEPFGNGVGVMLILIAIYQLDPRRRPLMARVVAMSLGSGLMANGVKMLIARVRPKRFDFHGGVFDTFGQWFPMLSEGSSGQSFPSAHTATAVGLAIALSWLYPRGRWYFATLAVLVALQRIESSYHFTSDTVFGAAVGFAVAFACLKNARVARSFERIERHLTARQMRMQTAEPSDDSPQRSAA